jgi:hypothetical protein
VSTTNGIDDGPTPVVIYAAKSTVDDGGSIPTQLADCRAAIEREGGRHIVAERCDEDASGYRGNRGPRLAEVMGLAERLALEGPVEVWVVHTDRLARGDGREARHLVEYVLWSLKAGVTLRSVQDPDACRDLLYAAVNGQRNHEDSKRKSAATRAGKQRRYEHGDSTGPLHDGYRLEPATGVDCLPITSRDGRVVQRRVPDPERGGIVRRMFELVEAGHSFGDVQRQLNAEGIRTRPRKGSPDGVRWTTRRVRETVQDPYYAGFVTSHGERRLGNHEPLIDAERFDRIQVSIRRLDPVAVKRRQGGRPSATTYLMRGIAFCAECGDAMYGRERSRLNSERLYVCRNRRECTGLCSAPFVRATGAESAAVNWLDKCIEQLHDWCAARLRDHQSDRAALTAAVDAERRRLADLDRRYANVQADYVRHAGDPRRAALVLDALEVIERDREDQRAVIHDAEARVGEWIVDPAVDAVLDFYNGIVGTIRDRLRRSVGADDMRAALHDLLEGVWMRVDPTTGDFHARFCVRVPDDLRARLAPEFDYRAMANVFNRLPIAPLIQTGRQTFV